MKKASRRAAGTRYKAKAAPRAQPAESNSLRVAVEKGTKSLIRSELIITQAICHSFPAYWIPTLHDTLISSIGPNGTNARDLPES